MTVNFIKNKLSKGDAVVGIWSIMGSAMTVEIAAKAGLDFQILDLEHGVYSMPDLEHCIRACELNQCSPFVRIPELNNSLIQNCLDLGAHGIIVPQLKTTKDVSQFLQANKFPPLGTRGFNPFTRAGDYDPFLPLASTRLNNTFGLTGVILENKSIFSNLDEMLAMPELDIFYLGIYDLSFDLGLEGDIHSPIIQEYLQSAIDKITKANKVAGLMAKDDKEIEKYVKMGVRFIVQGVDTHIYQSAIKNKVKYFSTMR